MEQMRLFAKNEIEPAIDYLFGQNMLGQIANVGNMPKQAIYQAAQTIFGKSVVDLANAAVVQDICITKFIPNILAIMHHSGLKAGMVTMTLAEAAQQLILYDMMQPDFKPMKAFDPNKVWNPNLDPADGHMNAFNPFIILFRLQLYIDMTKEFADKHVSFMNYLVCTADDAFEETLRKIYSLKDGEVARIWFPVLPSLDFTPISRMTEIVERFA